MIMNVNGMVITMESHQRLRDEEDAAEEGKFADEPDVQQTVPETSTAEDLQHPKVHLQY